MKHLINLVMIILVLFAAVLGNDLGKKLTIKEIFNSHAFDEESIEDIHWTNDGNGIVYRRVTGASLHTDFLYFDIKTGVKSIFLSGQEIRDENNEIFVPWNVIWSPNEKYLLFTDKLPARSTKSGGDFFLFNIKEKKSTNLAKASANQFNVQFSPDSKKIAYVRFNNLYLLDLNSKKETQLTFDGAIHILNGHFDWVYEEEFDIIEGWNWSPDGKYIAYWQIDESKVPEFEIPLFNTLYPKFTKLRYPKAGQNNSKVKVGAVNIETGKNTWFQFEENKDFYIPRIQWLSDSKNLAILKLNRLQNNIQIYSANVTNGEMNKIYEESDERWLEINDDWQILKDTNQYVWTSEKSGFRHIYLNNLNDNKNKQLTFGDWEVREVASVDEEGGFVYFTATKESPVENHIYRVDFAGSKIKQISERSGWHEPVFSPDNKYFLDNYSNLTTPTKTILYKNNGTRKSVLVENELEISDLYNLGIPEFIDVHTENKQELNGWMLKPPDFNSDHKYPLLIYTYGGPGSQSIKDKWGRVSLWLHSLAQNGYVIACADNRGTEGRGAEFKKSVYKKLGQIDVEDQIAAAKYFASLDFIDENRIGMYGWSYGGYMAAMCLLQGNDVFKVAVSVAPVTDWRFYDSIYTECFMQTPKLNPQGYEMGSVMNYVNRLEGKLLLIHGMTDDNVHFQNSVELTDELIRQNKQFDTMFYPGYKHSITAKKEHVYTKINNFILNNL